MANRRTNSPYGCLNSAIKDSMKILIKPKKNNDLNSTRQLVKIMVDKNPRKILNSNDFITDISIIIWDFMNLSNLSK